MVVVHAFDAREAGSAEMMTVVSTTILPESWSPCSALMPARVAIASG